MTQNNHLSPGTYHRYHIETRDTPDLVPWPSRFKVDVKRAGLAKLLVTEMMHYKGDLDVVLSRPCVYGVFSGPVGGFSPRSDLCVGCLRCTTQYPDWVTVRPNPARKALGDSYFTFEYVNAVSYEAATGRVPVKGAGYRGKFGGEGWDGMWTDMSEIVRPTRDGIHGRETISTSVDIGTRYNHLSFDENGRPFGHIPRTFSLPLPMILDMPPASAASPVLYKTLSQAAAELETLVMLPARAIMENNLRGGHVVPVLTPKDYHLIRILPSRPRLVMLDGWPPSVDDTLYKEIRRVFPDALIGLRTRFAAGEKLLAYIEAGISIFHLTASYHGTGPEGEWMFDQIRDAHNTLVEAGLREEVTLLGSGGVIAAEHVPKAIIGGLDAVVLDTPIMVALQAQFKGDAKTRFTENLQLPRSLSGAWAVQRIKNLAASWRDQLLEILGAMGLREVRRLRGEIGRAMFHKTLEREAFGDIEGYPGGIND